MAACKNLEYVPHTRVSDFGYPANSFVEVVQCDTNQFHRIYYGAAPSTSFANAPNGSTLWDFVNGNLYIKRGTLGLANGTWGYAAATT